MTEPTLTAQEQLAWLEITSTKWRDLIEKHPELLAFPCDVMGTSTAGGLLQHIVAVELRYAERLSGLPATDYANIPFTTAAEIYATHAQAMTLYKAQLASSSDWSQDIEFLTRDLGLLKCTRKTMFIHAMMHSIRHYAQLATIVRQHGIKPGWPMDYLFMGISIPPSKT
jgi:uncharacterized damage-inducible protein DinB